MLELLGMAAFLLTVAFTIWAATGQQSGHGQSRRSAIFEAWTNVVIGFSVNYFANFAILPLIGVHISPADNFWLGWLYTAVSVMRSYAIRRWFNARLKLFIERVSGGAR